MIVLHPIDMTKKGRQKKDEKGIDRRMNTKD